MPTTLTLKNIPDEVYQRLKASAQTHRRSLNSEAIVCLESVLVPGRVAVSERQYAPPPVAGGELLGTKEVLGFHWISLRFL